MKSHAKAVVIGGGVVGASVLYHLTKVGWRDVVLVERSELTSGSTWHAAGGMHTINGDPNVAKLQQYTINLYKEIEEISGVSCGVHITGGLMLDLLQIEGATLPAGRPPRKGSYVARQPGRAKAHAGAIRKKRERKR